MEINVKNDSELMDMAKEAMKSAYAPYSHFAVGAAVETDDGEGNIIEEEVEETTVYLYITVSHKTVEEMMEPIIIEVMNSQSMIK